MFSLIITIITIALVAALALATIYYGGHAFNQGADPDIDAINKGVKTPQAYLKLNKHSTSYKFAHLV